jgi:N-carbamoyl-L-amino-acid hydrolase
MDLRADAGVAAAQINLHLRALVASGRFGPDLRATMGMVSPHPNIVNVVPGRVTCSVDVRNPDDAILEQVEAEVIEYYSLVAREEKVSIAHRRTARTPYVPFAAQVQERVSAAAAARGLSQQRIVSGAGHDAQELARVCPTGMIFVPGEYDGISHNPREHSTEQQCANGVNVLLDVALSFAEEAGQ